MPALKKINIHTEKEQQARKMIQENFTHILSRLKSISVSAIVCCVIFSATGLLPAHGTHHYKSASRHVLLRKKEQTVFRQPVTESRAICGVTCEENEDNMREFPPATKSEPYLESGESDKEFRGRHSSFCFRNVPLYIFLHSWKTFPLRL